MGCKRFSWLRGVGCGFRRPLSMEDRAAIGAGLESGLCQARIARTLGRSPPRAHRASGWGGRRSGRAQTPSRAPRPPGRRESHRGTLAALGQISPHWGRLITCPNASFPTPMTRRLPQCTVLPAPMQSSPVQDRTTTAKRPPEPTPTASLTRPGPNNDRQAPARTHPDREPHPSRTAQRPPSARQNPPRPRASPVQDRTGPCQRSYDRSPPSPPSPCSPRTRFHRRAELWVLREVVRAAFLLVLLSRAVLCLSWGDAVQR